MSGGVYTGLAGLTKGGLNAATRALAIEYAEKRIRFNAVAPGVIRTPMHAEENLQFFGKYHPLGRIGEASEVIMPSPSWKAPNSLQAKSSTWTAASTPAVKRPSASRGRVTSVARYHAIAAKAFSMVLMVADMPPFSEGIKQMNTAHVTDYFKALANKDAQGIVAHLSDDIVLHGPIFPEPTLGKEAVVQILSGFLATIDALEST
jgi:hypothetical protein